MNLAASSSSAVGLKFALPLAKSYISTTIRLGLVRLSSP